MVFNCYYVYDEEYKLNQRHWFVVIWGHPSKTFGRRGGVSTKGDDLGRSGGSAINRTSRKNFFWPEFFFFHFPPVDRNIFCVSDVFTLDTVRTSEMGWGPPYECSMGHIKQSLTDKMFYWLLSSACNKPRLPNLASIVTSRRVVVESDVACSNTNEYGTDPIYWSQAEIREIKKIKRTSTEWIVLLYRGTQS